MNISSAILDLYQIGGMPLSDYKDFVESDTGRTKLYRIKLQTNKNGILMQSLKNGKTFMLKCVKDYYSTCEMPLTIDTCSSCRLEFDLNEANCFICHKKCFERYNNNELIRITARK